MQTTNINLKGVTRVPDDTACENGDLAIALNLAADGDGLKMLEKPESLFQLRTGEVLLCIHQNDGYKHYITTYDGKLWWGNRPVSLSPLPLWSPNEIGATSATQATVMGNTIITQGTIMEYWLWDQTLNDNAGGYKKLNDKPPMVLMRFGLESELEVFPGYSSSDGKPADPIDICGWISRDDIEMPYIGSASHTGPGYHEKASEVLPQSLIDAMNSDSDLCFNYGGSTIEATHVAWMKQESPNLHNYTFENVVGKRSENSGQIDNFVQLMTDKVMSTINKFIAKKATDEGKFVFPFYVRYCYELYDGSQMMASNPVLLVPNSRAPVFMVNGDDQMGGYTWDSGNSEKRPSSVKGGLTVEFDGEGGSYGKTSIAINGRVWAFISQLNYILYAPGMYTRSGGTITQSEDWTNWKDLIKSVGIYITPGIYTYDQDGKVYGWKNMEAEGAWDSYFTEGIVKKSDYNTTTNSDHVWNGRVKLVDCMYGSDKDQHYNNLWSNNWVAVSGTTTLTEHTGAPWCIMRVPEKSLADIRKTAIETVQFYKIAEIPYEDILSHESIYFNDFVASNIPIQGSTLSTLTNRRQLVDGDYAQFDKINAECQYVYNRRLHIANVSREYCPPLDPIQQIPIANGGSAYHVSEAININNYIGATTSAKSIYGTLRPLFVYHPNKDARKAIFRWGAAGADCTAYPLIEHPVLNGAYWLSPDIWVESENANERVDVLPPTDSSGNPIDDDDIEVTFPTATDPEVEHLYGEVWTSNVENPFVFQAGNVNQVGDGVIKALRAAVAPLAEDQHGYAPMYVFTSQGVWAMTFSKDGTPAAIDHICGDIITEGTEPLSLGQSCLVMTDRGLLGLAGRSVKNLGEKIDGKYANATIANFTGAQGLLGIAYPENPDVVSSFVNVLRGKSSVKMSFDYHHQRVYVWLSSGGAWVLNLKTGLWTQTGKTCSQAINAYPSCEFVGSFNTGSSMVNNVVQSLDTESLYSAGLLLTRPIKLTEAQAKLREVAVRGFFNPDLVDREANAQAGITAQSADLWTVLHGSRDWHNYGLVASSKGYRITRLGGSAYRSHVVSVILRNADATIDRIVLTVDQEQGNRLR